MTKLTSSHIINNDSSQFVERRSVRRKQMDIVVSIQASDGDIEAHMRDLSVQGCSLQASERSPRLGQIIKMEMAGVTSVSGIVRWLRDDMVGIEFLRPLTDASIVAIVASNRPN